MFNEVRDTAIDHKNDFLSQVRACVRVCDVCPITQPERQFCPPCVLLNPEGQQLEASTQKKSERVLVCTRTKNRV